MPELPDVEAFRKVLVSCAQGAVIRRVDVYDTGVLHGASARTLRSALEGRTFGTPQRHGKWLLARIEGDGAGGGLAEEGSGDGGRRGNAAGGDSPRGGGTGDAGTTLLLHFGMTGKLVCCDPDEELHAHDRAVFTVGPGKGSGGGPDGGGRSGRGKSAGDRQLRYRDQRKLKGLWLVDDSGAERMLRDQGPDAATLTRAQFDDLPARRRGGLKSALTDQSVLAGLGNLLADEILWRARLRPDARVGTLTGAERERLYTQLRRTVDSAVRAGRVPSRDSWLTGHRDESPGTCPRCGGPLRHDRVSGRGTVWCPRCQGGGLDAGRS
jgi:formamidopyrimidine-DNA glycosylase